MNSILSFVRQLSAATALSLAAASAIAAPTFSIVVPKSPGVLVPGNQGQGGGPQGGGGGGSLTGNCASPDGTIVLDISGCSGFVGGMIATPGNSLSVGVPGQGLLASGLEVVSQGFPAGVSVAPASVPFQSYPFAPNDSLFSGLLRAGFEFAGAASVSGEVLIRNPQTGQGAKVGIQATIYPSLFRDVPNAIQLNVNPNLYVPFGSVAVGAFSEQDILVRNYQTTSTELFAFSTMSFGPNAVYSVEQAQSTCQVGTVLAPGQSCTVRVRASVPSGASASMAPGILNVRDSLYSTLYQDHNIGLVTNN